MDHDAVTAAPRLRSFWIGGFDSVDPEFAAQAPRFAEQLAAARAAGVAVVRVSIGWRLAEPAPGRWQLERALAIAAAARASGVQVLWTLMERALPADLSLVDERLVERFAAFAREVATVLAPFHDDAPIYTPIAGLGVPNDPTLDDRIRVRLVRAWLQACAAMRGADPRARFMTLEPLLHVVADSREAQPLARAAQSAPWRVIDQLLGRESPELGGHEAAFDFAGFSHDTASQWSLPSRRRLARDGSDPRRRALADLLEDAARRCRGKPIVLARTGDVGAERANWLHEIASQAREALRRRVPLIGLGIALLDHADHADRDHLAALRAWQRWLPTPRRPEPALTIVAFSPRRWHGAFARPQQLLSRLAERHRVVYVEEPVHAPGPARLIRASAGPTIEIVTPCTPIGEPGFHDSQIAGLKPLLDGHLQTIGGEFVAWFCTAMALPLAASLRARAVVYDCLAERGAAKDAPRQLRQRESALMRSAQLVLAHGPGLYEARRDEHANIHCLPGGVDTLRFAPEAIDEASAAARLAERLQRDIAAPRLGFYGVIDERIDLALVERLADADAQWQIVMVGPVHVEHARLPRRPNLHWLGLQPHELLPHLLTSWQVCLLPLRCDASTRHANPGQALEYLASGKPVVATAIADVATLYGEVVALAEDHERFVVACARALFEEDEQRRERESRTRALVNGCSWTHCAERAATLFDELLAQPAPHSAAPDEAEPAPATPAMPASRRARTRAITHLVVGGGVTGLAAAWQLGQDGLASRTLLVERADRLGAAHRRHEADGCPFEHADLGLPDGALARELMPRLLGRNLQWRTTQMCVAGGAATMLSLPAPARGGIQALLDAFMQRVACPVALETSLLRLMPASRTARLDDGRSIHYEHLISTIALPDLANACGEELPPELRSAAAALRTRPARSVFLAVQRHDPLATDVCLIVPHRGAPFHRAWVSCRPEGFGRDGLIIVRLDLAPPAGAGEHAQPSVAQLLSECRRRGLVRAHERLVAHWDLQIAQGHPLDDALRAHHLQSLRSWFAAHGIELAGHFGAWGGDHGLHAIEAGASAVERLRRAVPPAVQPATLSRSRPASRS